VASVPAAFLDGTKAAQEASQGDIANARATMAEITARATASAATTAEAMRATFATPAPGQQALTMPAAKMEQPIGAIVSSMAKIGGDQGYAQTSAVDYARQQLQAQQETAKNTAKMVDKLNKLQPSSSNMGAVYQ
jgi:hypothetical protein